MIELLSESSAAWVALVGIVGLLVGSFLNVVIHRLPIMLERDWRAQLDELNPRPGAAAADHDAALAHATTQVAGTYNLVVPRSACPACNAPIKSWQNIPVLSWLLLKGKCANCKAPISLRYPLVELCCALLSGAVAWRFGFGWNAVAALAVTWALIALTGIDIDTQLLPDAITLPLLWAGLLASLFVGAGVGGSIEGTAGLANLPVTPAGAIVGAAIGYLSLWSVFHVFRLCTGKEGMGYGDFKLLAALGAWLGVRMLLPIVLLSALAGALVGIALILSGRHRRGVPMPFGPFLAAAGWLAMMWGPQWVATYLGLYSHG
ncbi:MAG: prepilin peptidase [Steroidobacteraceae bacterium]